VADRDRRPPDLTPLPGAIPTKPGSATLPFFGVSPSCSTRTRARRSPTTAAEGVLCLKDSWPGQMRTVWGDHERFEKTYFSDYKGYYFSGDGCRRDADGYYWITGRVDDVINVSGHRMGTAEVESALVAHAKVAEAAVVGYPHPIKGQGIYCYVTLMNGVEPTDALRKELRDWVRPRSGRSPSPTSSSGRRACPRRARARSCAASCARSPRTTSARWATPRRWPIRRWSRT
jgi:acetyl-CoA synthetase